MILPITAYGHPTLRKTTSEINQDYKELQELISNMFATMYISEGVGLAAPQVNLSIRLFIIDASPMGEEDEKCKGFKKVFINPYILEDWGKTWTFNEGCLSIPGVREDIKRPDCIKIEYYDENWNLREEDFCGIRARIIQHEYDHLEGVMFSDHLPALKKRLLKSKFTNISSGKVKVDYRMIFPKKKIT